MPTRRQLSVFVALTLSTVWLSLASAQVTPVSPTQPAPEASAAMQPAGAQLPPPPVVPPEVRRGGPQWANRSPLELFRSLERFGASVFAPPAPAPDEQAEPAGQAAAGATPTAEPADAVTGTGGSSFASPTLRPTSAQPVVPTGMPVPADYVLGPGDVLEVHVWSRGRERHASSLAVNGEGAVVLPAAGRILLAGQTQAQAVAAVTAAFARLYDAPDVALAVSTQRSLDIYVLGDVTRPGRHSLVGMATVFSALYAAGGPSPAGSLRAVKLVRRGQPARIVDLYDLLLKGDAKDDVILQGGDTVFVETVRAEVGLSGEVKRPARYELTEGTTLGEALQMAGGLTATAYTPLLELWRTQDRASWQLANLPAGDAALKMVLNDGDLLVAKPLLETPTQVVTIKGLVRRPGVYELSPGLTVAQLLNKAEGLADGANAAQGLIWSLAPDTSYTVTRFAPDKALAGQPGADLVLKARDIVELLPQEKTQVEIRGATRRPGLYAFGRGMRVSDLVVLAGGLQPEAHTSRADLLRLGADRQYSVLSVSLDKALAGDLEADSVLHDGDILEVKTASEAAAPMVVDVNGYVNRPGQYPRRAGMKVSDAIFAAGGFAPGACSVEIQRGRVAGISKPIQIEVLDTPTGPQLKTDELVRDDDLVSVQGQGDFVVTPESVFVKGPVGRPGCYGLAADGAADHDTVWGVLRRAGGLQDEANPESLLVYRGYPELFSQSGDLQTVLDNLNRQARYEEKQLPDAARQALATNVTNQLSQSFASGRHIAVVVPPRTLRVEQAVRAIPVDGQKLLATEGREGDLRLEAGDIVVVSKKRDTVVVMGAVRRPGAFALTAQSTADACLEIAGGPSEDAAVSRTIVLGPNGVVRPGRQRAIVKPGDVIVVPSQHIIRRYAVGSGWEMALENLANLATVFLLR